MSEKRLVNSEQRQSLRIASPELYDIIIEELEKHNIHSYDIEMNANKDENGIQIILLYGEKFNYEKERYFSYQTIETDKSEIIKFANETGEDCKEIMIKEYFKMMRP